MPEPFEFGKASKATYAMRSPARRRDSLAAVAPEDAAPEDAAPEDAAPEDVARPAEALGVEPTAEALVGELDARWRETSITRG